MIPSIQRHCGAWSPYMLSILRIVSGYLFILHGIVKASGAEFDLLTLMGLAASIEIVAGLCLILGFWTRTAAFIASGEMAFAYFMGHASRGSPLLPVFNGGDAAILFCFVFLYLAMAGPGPWSIDALRRRN